MRKRFLDLLRCPKCAGSLVPRLPLNEEDNEVRVGELHCHSCSLIYPIIDGVPRFVSSDNYTASFGMQWNKHSNTQLDSINGTSISQDRFHKQSRWSKNLGGEKILEAGCGMGRFSEIALSTGAECFSFDYSNAVDAAYRNTQLHRNSCIVQASIYEIPFPKEFFDKIFCFGVLQHTPDVRKSFESLLPFLKPGGSIVIDVYASPWNWFHPRRLFRPFTKRMNPQKLHKAVLVLVPPLLAVSNAVAKIPKIGSLLKIAVPVANYKGRYHLTKDQVHEWAILDTFDWFSPRYDQPQRKKILRQWFDDAGLEDIEIERDVGIYVARGKKPLPIS